MADGLHPMCSICAHGTPVCIQSVCRMRSTEGSKTQDIRQACMHTKAAEEYNSVQEAGTACNLSANRRNPQMLSPATADRLGQTHKGAYNAHLL